MLYIVITALNRISFIQSCNDLIDTDVRWKPVGGVFINQNGFHQAFYYE